MLETIINLLFGTGVVAAFDPLTLASLAMSLGGGVASMVGSANLNKTRQNNLNTQKAENEAWYNKEYYTDELDRSENKSVLRTLSDQLKDRNKESQATAAITGATPEMAIAEKNNSNKVYANVVNRLAGKASQRKDLLNREYRYGKRSLANDQDNLDSSKSSTWSNLGSNAAALGANAIGTMGATTGGSPKTGTNFVDNSSAVIETPLLT